MAAVPHTSSASDVARALREAGSDRHRLMADLYAETVDLRHVPPLESDGPVAGRVLAEVSSREVAAVAAALPDRTETSDITVEGDDGIRMVGSVAGTMPDGRGIDVTTDVLLTVADGQIVGLEAALDEATMAAWGAVLAAGGFEIPEGLLPD